MAAFPEAAVRVVSQQRPVGQVAMRTKPTFNKLSPPDRDKNRHFWRTRKRLNSFQPLTSTFCILGLNIWLVCEVTYAIIERLTWKILLIRS